jgi:hypothetical protein
MVICIRFVWKLVQSEDFNHLALEQASAWGYNQATLFLKDINTWTWSSSLGESRN